MRLSLSYTIYELSPNITYGSHAQLVSGTGATQLSPGDCDKGWFAGDTTLILGAGGKPGPDAEKSVATWRLAVQPDVVRRMHSGFLLIACERPQGGLHTLEYGAIARVDVNDLNRDIIGLKDIPSGHTDYFHRVGLPRLPEIWPISACGTIYSWPIHRTQLRESGNQVVRLEIDPGVAWDIDYVALAITTARTVSRIPELIKPVIYGGIAVLLAEIVRFLLGR